MKQNLLSVKVNRQGAMGQEPGSREQAQQARRNILRSAERESWYRGQFDNE